MTDSYRSFAYSAATESVRQNSKELLIKGIYAIIIEDDRNDFRDNITSLTLLYHSGLLLGLDPEGEFKKADGFNKEYLAEDNYSEPTDKKLISGK
jgi:hypothetical protein